MGCDFQQGGDHGPAQMFYPFQGIVTGQLMMHVFDKQQCAEIKTFIIFNMM